MTLIRGTPIKRPINGTGQHGSVIGVNSFRARSVYLRRLRIRLATASTCSTLEPVHHHHHQPSPAPQSPPRAAGLGAQDARSARAHAEEGSNGHRGRLDKQDGAFIDVDKCDYSAIGHK
jgi:hypothetical protein